MNDRDRFPAANGRLLLVLAMACWTATHLVPLGVGFVANSARAAEPEGATAPRQLRTAYLYDAAAHARANRNGRNHWDLYLREILDELGLRADEVGLDLLADAGRLDRYATLLVGGLSAEPLPQTTRDNLDRWVQGGGTLILFATEGLHELCGNRPQDSMQQPDSQFACTATFELQPHALTRDIHSTVQPEQRLLVFSDVRKVRADRSVELARLFDLQGHDTECAAVTARQLGKGNVFYFAFSVPQTMWVLHQGRPVDRDYDGDNILRRSDAIVIRPHSIEVAYADEILFLLQNMIAVQPSAFVHQLPPDPEGNIPDALFHWGGDDEGSTDGIQLFASNWMKAHGLPYHINAMPRADGTFGLTIEDARRIKDNGHEISLHFNFIDGFAKGTGFTRDDVLAQAAAFRQHFGQDWVCSVNHWTRWTGWTEPAEWMLEAGGKSDNTFVHAGSPPGNPTNLLGFSFGTAFPFWLYDDWRDENRRIDFLEQPITAYECGYIGQDRADFATIHKVVDVAARYHQTMNMFYHPVYIAKYPYCRETIEEMLRYLDERNIRPLHWGSDELYHWWKARSQTNIGPVTSNGHTLSVEVESAYAAGVVVKIPLGPGTVRSVTVNGASATFATEQRFGQNWLLAVVPSGKGLVRVVLTGT